MIVSAGNAEWCEISLFFLLKNANLFLKEILIAWELVIGNHVYN